MTFCRADVFRDRPTTFAGELSHDDWRLKCYDISHDGAPIEPVFDDVMPLALAQLPQPAVAADRPGVGFVIRHQGAEWQYLVLCWWDSQNELVQRLFVRPRNGPDAAAA